MIGQLAIDHVQVGPADPRRRPPSREPRWKFAANPADPSESAARRDAEVPSPSRHVSPLIVVVHETESLQAEAVGRLDVRRRSQLEKFLRSSAPIKPAALTSIASLCAARASMELERTKFANRLNP